MLLFQKTKNDQSESRNDHSEVVKSSAIFIDKKSEPGYNITNKRKKYGRNNKCSL